MTKHILLIILIVVAASSLLYGQYTEVYNQPYPGGAGNLYTSTYDSATPADYEQADNFSGVTDPITKISFWGATGLPAWTPAPPLNTEPFNVKFYELEEEWTLPPVPDPGILAPETGTYTVNLYDSYGDSWNGGSLDVLVNGTEVLIGITLGSGAGPAAFTFDATAGDYIMTIYHEGGWGYENWYEILSPSSVVIATDGDDTQSDPPTGIGVLPEPPLVAPVLGTYTLSLYDSYGDGWNGASLDVYVNNVMILEGLTIDDGTGPVDFTFDLTTGDVIATVYHSGEYDSECTYSIFLPSEVLLAEDGPVPSGIGFVSTLEKLEPVWSMPVASYTLPAVSTWEENLTWGGWSIYKFEIELPAPLTMEEGWVSVQMNVDAGASLWFLWAPTDPPVDNQSWQRVDSKGKIGLLSSVSAGARPEISNDMAFTLFTGTHQYDIPANTPTEVATGVELESDIDLDINETIDETNEVVVSLPNYDDMVDPVVIGLTGTGVTDLVFTVGAGTWYGTLYVGGTWYQGNPYPLVGPGTITFAGVDFDAKGDVIVVLSEGSDPTLPVQLSSFTAVLTGDMYVQIAWVAESETNHSGYNILRSESMELAEAIKINATLIEEGSSLGSQISYSFIDSEAYINMQYYYWLESVALDGVVSHYGPLTVTIGDPELDPVAPTIPKVTTLHNAFPNPFNPSTTIGYYMAEGGNVDIQIYNLRGQLMKSFTATHADKGTYYMSWDGRDTNGQPVGSGIYLYRMTSGNYSSTKKMVLSK